MSDTRCKYILCNNASFLLDLFPLLISDILAYIELNVSLKISRNSATTKIHVFLYIIFVYYYCICGN